ncbi:MAG: CsbD family protein [Luteimonas sp.]
MDHKRIDGLGHEIKGTVKEHVGQATGNRSQQVEGNIEKNAGKAEQMIDALVDRIVDGERKP